MAGEREGKGGKEWEQRGNTAERGGGKEEDGGEGRGWGCRERWRAPISQGQGLHGGGGLWKSLVEGLLVVLGRLGLSLSIRAEELLGDACVLMASTLGLTCA